MFKFEFYLFLCVNLISVTYCNEVREELCVDSTCTVPISQARGAVRYAGDKSNRLSFKRGKEITIISKTKNEKDYWGAIIDGHRGYVPSHLVQEMKVYHPTDKLISVLIKEKIANETSQKTQEKKEEYILDGKLQGKNTLEANTEKYNVHDHKTGSQAPPLTQFKEESLTLAPENMNFEKNEFPMADTPFRVIEGTTVFDDVTYQITPSTVSSHTSASVVKNEHVPSGDEVKEKSLHFTSIDSSILNSVSQSQNNFIPKSVVTDDFKDETKKHVESLGFAAGVNEEHDRDGGYKSNNNNNNNNNEDGDDDDGDNEDIDDDDDDDDGDDDGGGGGGGAAAAADSHDTEVDCNVDVEDEDDDIYNNDGDNKTDEKELHTNNGSIPSQVLDISSNYSIEEPNADNAIRKNISVNYESASVPVENLHLAGNITEAVSSRQKPITEQNKSLVQQEQFMDDLPSHIKAQDQMLDSLSTESEPGKKDAFSSQPTMNPQEQNVEGNDDKNPQEQKIIPNHKLNDVGSLLYSNLYPSHVPSTHKTNEMPFMQEQHTDTPETEPLIQQTTIPPVSHQPLPELPNQHSTQTFKYDIPSQPVVDPFLHHSDAVFPDAIETPATTTENYQQESPTPTIKSDSPEIPRYSQSPTQEEDTFISQVTDAFISWFVPASSNEQNSNHDTTHHDTQSEPSSDGQSEELLRSVPHAQPSDTAVDGESEDQPSYWNQWLSDSLPGPSKTFVYLVVTAVTVLVFTLGHNFIEKKVKSGPLIAKINKLEQKLFVTSKECLQLKDEVQKARDKISLYESSSNDELIVSLQLELEESKKVRAELESSIEVLQQELDSATEAGLDLNKMLSEVLTQKGGSESLLESVENLQSQLNNQQRIIDEMTNKLGAKNEENEGLQLSLDAANEKVEALEEELAEVKSDLDAHLKEKDSTTQDLKEQIDQLNGRITQLSESKQKEIGKLKKQLQDLKKEVKEKAEELVVKEEECEAIKQATKQLKMKGNGNLEALFDVSKAKAELLKIEKDYKLVKEELEKEKADKKVLETRIEVLDVEIKKLTDLCDSAKEKEEEALKKLDVLSKYFKEKETQLQKELVCQEALWAQKKGDENAVYNIMKSLQEEVESYKSQNETLKKEILDQERGLKNQIASLEQKVHENWVAARQAERKLEESRHENAQLRNRLTLVEKSGPCDTDGKSNNRPEDLNGIEATSPVLPDASSPLLFPPLPLDPGGSALLPPNFIPHPMFMPPPMTGFMPPPPFLPGDRRPPPLGRMSSPPLTSQFSPPPHDYSFERMSSPPLSPLARSYRSSHDGDREKENSRHKTPPYPPLYTRKWDGSNNSAGFIPITSQRDSKRENKGSKVSSGHSSSDSLEQTNKNVPRV